MRHLRPSRAAVAAAILLLASAPAAFADTTAADADTVTPGVQGKVDLGDVAPGATMTVPLDFVLACKGTSHVDAGETVTVTFAGGTIPDDGAATFDQATIGPITGFPADGDACASPAETARTSTPMHVDLRAPTTDGGHDFTFMFEMAVSNGDSGSISNSIAFATLTLTVVSNTPPTLELPTSFTVEGNEPNGAGVTWLASAADSEDATAPMPICSPASGSHFALGTTSVSCSATDTGGLAATGSFDVTVADTTAPMLSGAPASIETTTADADGTAVTFVPPTASDVVDPHPTVTCSPASGATFPVGSTTVTCTSTDTTGNHSTASFDVRVRLGQASFDAPIGPSDAVDANGSRSIPVKARLTLDGSDVTTGDATLVVRSCGGAASVRSVDLVWSSGRWTGKLDTSGLSDGCWRASVVVGSAVLGGFDLQVPATTTPSKATAAPRGNRKP